MKRPSQGKITKIFPFPPKSLNISDFRGKKLKIKIKGLKKSSKKPCYFSKVFCIFSLFLRYYFKY